MYLYRSRELRSLVAAVLVQFVLIPGVAADEPTAAAGIDRSIVTRDRPELSIQRLPRAPTLEDFLDMEPPEDLRALMPPITGFVQRDPEDGRPASQMTHVHLGYDERHLYVVFVAFDEEPGRVRANMSRREDVFGDETVEIQIDTFNDQRRAFSFLTNPFGIQWDAIWTEGQGFDPAWDTVWQSSGALTERGYVVRMAIPFKSLRFPARPEDGQIWRVIFVRDIPRNNETSFWPRVSSRIEGRLNQAATATGVSEVAQGRNVWLIPYGTARSFRLDDEGIDDEDAEIGLDAKWVLRESLALDLTVNPDFSQVESDEPQVTVNERFEVFFPERRPFFLENADYFRTPLNLLFTRRIAAPSAGGRLTGKLGDYRLGALIIDDEAPGKIAQPGDPLRGSSALNGVLRLSRDVSEQSNLGFMVTTRELEDGHNRVGGLDARIKLDDNWDARVHAVYSDTLDQQGESFSDTAYSVVFNRSARRLNAHLHYQDIGEEFRTELGFVPRVDVRDAHSQISYSFWTEGKRLVRWTPRIFVQRIVDHEDLRLDALVNSGVEWEFRRQTEVELFGSFGRERLRPRDFDSLDEPRDYRRTELGAEFSTRFIASVRGALSVSGGRTTNFAPADGAMPEPAERRGARINLTLRPLDRLRIENTFLYTQLDDRASGDEILTDQILRVRFDTQFSRRLSLRVILQNDRTSADPALTSVEPRRNWNGDLLATYLINPWTAFYVGYNGNYRRAGLEQALGVPPLPPGDRYDNNASQLFLKVSYLFRP